MFFQRVLPKKMLSEFLGFLANLKGGVLTTAFIRFFIKKYKVNMEEALHSDPAYFNSFNSFFVRALKKDARPLAAADLVCPVDGAISQCGRIEKDHIYQAKNKGFTTTALLGGDAQLASQFEQGRFATIYLSPKDYHRIHMPCKGYLKQMVYIPGDLYSVNPLTARTIDALFARNERVVCLFEGESGPFVMVLVGATVVGSIQTQWHGVVNSPRPGNLQRWDYDGSLCLEKGAEMGRFRLGSTVVLLFTDQSYELNPMWQAETPVRLGEAMSAPTI